MERSSHFLFLFLSCDKISDDVHKANNNLLWNGISLFDYPYELPFVPLFFYLLPDQERGAEQEGSNVARSIDDDYYLFNPCISVASSVIL